MGHPRPRLDGNPRPGVEAGRRWEQSPQACSTTASGGRAPARNPGPTQVGSTAVSEGRAESRWQAEMARRSTEGLPKPQPKWEGPPILHLSR